MRVRLVICVVALAAAFIAASPASAARVNSPGPVQAWQCIHSYEASSWYIMDYPYEGGLQMDYGFMKTYGYDFYLKHGRRWAHAWTIREQMIAANRARVGVDWRGSTWPGPRGFTPWPNTARKCGLL